MDRSIIISEVLLNVTDNPADNITVEVTMKEEPEMPIDVVVPLMVLFAAIVPPIVIGNVLIILSYIRFKQLSSVNHLMILSTAIADLLVGVAAVPSTILFRFLPIALSEDNPVKTALTSPLACGTWAFFAIVPVGVSVFSLFGISLCLVVTFRFPLKYKEIVSRRRARCYIIFCWLYMSVFGFAMMGMAFNKDHNSGLGKSCNFDHFPSSFTLPSLGINIMVPLVGIVVCYIIVYRSTAQLKVRQQKHHYFNKLNCPLRMAKLMGIIIGVFTLSWIPLVILFVVTDNDSPLWMRILHHVFSGLAFANSAMNVIIYSFKNTTYSKAFKHILSCSKEPFQFRMTMLSSCSRPESSKLRMSSSPRSSPMSRHSTLLESPLKPMVRTVTNSSMVVISDVIV